MIWQVGMQERLHDRMTWVPSGIALLLTPAVTCDSKIHWDSVSLASSTFLCVKRWPLMASNSLGRIWSPPKFFTSKAQEHLLNSIKWNTVAPPWAYLSWMLCLRQFYLVILDWSPIDGATATSALIKWQCYSLNRDIMFYCCTCSLIYNARPSPEDGTISRPSK